MKLTVALIGVFIIQAKAEVRPQDRITLAIKNAPLEAIFKEITKQTSYQCIFPEQFRQMSNRVDISVSNATIEEVLAICFKDQPFTYTIVKKIIIVKQKESKSASAQTVSTSLTYNEIHGQVTNEKQEPLEKASVEIEGVKRGTFTDANGMFELKQVDENAVLKVSFAGFLTKKINLEKKTSVSIMLSPNNSPMEEIQVIAYGTVSKRLNTGDVSTVKAIDIEKQPVNNPLLALQGRVPGMLITQSTGYPGAGVKVQIRGQNSIANGNDPLYIIDGVPYTANNLSSGITYVLGYSSSTTGNPFSYINPADIASIDVLKDADATAIYGSRGANGVVLITTKKGKSGSAKVDINAQSGFGKVSHKLGLLNTRQYLDMRYEAFKNDGAMPNPNADYDLTLWDTTRYTDWQKELIGGSALYNDVQTSVSGGSANVQYLIGGGYHRETTVFPGDFFDRKGSGHFNINAVSPNGKLKATLSGLYLVDNNRLSGYDLTEQAMKLAPDAPAMYKPDGSINWAPNAAGNTTWSYYSPASMLLLTFKTQTNNLVSNATLSYELFPGLEIKTSLGYTNTQDREVQTIPLKFQDPSAWAYKQRSSLFSNNNISSWLIEPQISYTRHISKGTFKALVGTTIQQNTSIGQALGATGFNSDLVMEDIASATSITTYPGINTVYKYNAGFGRLNYNWQDKYLLDVTVRRDGSSRFGPANQFHNFGALGLGWIFSQESFLQKWLPFLSYGKLRGSYGTTGSDQVGDYTFMDLYNPLSNIGVPYQGAVGTAPNRIFTPDLAWEETRKLEAGLELGILKDRILFMASYYRNRSTNQLVAYSLPAIAGFTSVEKNLDAQVQNKGWEFEFRTVNINTGDFRWTSSLNLTMNRNKLVSGAPGLSQTYQQKIGHPLNSIFVYHFLGVDPIKGSYQVAGKDGKVTDTPDPSTDKTVMIDYTPKFYGGFQNSFSYKGFLLDFLFQFSQKKAMNYLYNYIPGFFNNSSGANQPVTVLQRWQKPGDVSSIQRFSQNLSVYTPWNNAQQSDQLYSDASYIRLKNLSLSWQLPKGWQQSLHLQNARLYVQGQNLLTITSYKGLDPETVSSLVLPPLRVITMGIQLTL